MATKIYKEGNYAITDDGTIAKTIRLDNFNFEATGTTVKFFDQTNPTIAAEDTFANIQDKDGGSVGDRSAVIEYMATFFLGSTEGKEIDLLTEIRHNTRCLNNIVELITEHIELTKQMF